MSESLADILQAATLFLKKLQESRNKLTEIAQKIDNFENLEKKSDRLLQTAEKIQNDLNTLETAFEKLSSK
ncbi:unnamed protein product [Brachionus calyciflorus]|uniref:Uncharacterized protein n=1 Tax=Brachionus calyciflorus TaxID=104777 RepID=A0A813ZNY4_9BILA|nr:unnamed protein product [Brachionus calyciflorus]